MRLHFLRSPAPCTRTWSCTPAWHRARRCSCTAARAVSARWPSSWRGRSEPGSRAPLARPAKLARCRELGAELTVNYREQDFAAAVLEFTGGRGADVILDIMGAVYLARNVTALATGGRLVVIGMQGGTSGELDLGRLMQKRATVHGSTLRSRPLAEKAAIVTAVREGLWPLVGSGQVRPVIQTVLPLAQAASAHRLMESSEHVGKILLATATARRERGTWLRAGPDCALAPHRRQTRQHD